MLQTTQKTVEVKYIDSVVDALVIKKKLIPMIQRVQKTPPKSRSSDIIEHTMTDRVDQVQAQLDDARHAESNSCAMLEAVS